MKKKSNIKLMQIILHKFENNKKQEAVLALEKYLNDYPGDTIARYNYALISNKIGRVGDAIKNYNIVIKEEPSHWQSKLNLCLIYFHLNKFNEALDFINDVIDINPDNQSALREKAHILYKLNNLDNALKFIIASVKINQKDYIALNIMGMIYSGLKEYKLAISIYKKAINLNSNYYPSYSNISKCLVEINQRDEAAMYLQKCLNLNPNFIEAINNLANIKNTSGDYIEAIKLYKQILINHKKHPDVNLNIAIAYFHNKDFKNADKYFTISKIINHHSDKFKKNYSYFLLYKQKYKEAWSIADGRLNLKEFSREDSWINNFRNKIWHGEKINKNEKILIVKEQGVGDEILYSTMYSEALDYFSNIKIESEERLLSLFTRSYGNVNNFIPALSISNDKDKLKKIDKVIFSASLAKIFRNTKESFLKQKFLIPDKSILKKINLQLENISQNKKIGISWKSKRVFFGESKSINLNNFFKFIKNEKIDYINLQYGDIKKDLEEVKKEYKYEIKNLDNLDLYNDFEKISALLKNLDLFITVSNSTAHLAGALNVETLLIKPKANALFHYWNQPNNKCPWYPSVKLIDQSINIEDTALEIKKIIYKKFNF